MTPHETALVTTLLEPLKTMVVQPKDADAETLIRQATAQQPDDRANSPDPRSELVQR